LAAIDKIVELVVLVWNMPSPGSMIRLLIGALLAIEVLRDWFMLSGQLSSYAGWLAAAFVAMTAVYLVFHF